MKKNVIIITVVSLIVVFMLLIGLYLYNFNAQTTKEEQALQQQTQELKTREEQRSGEFAQQQVKKTEELTQEERARNEQDNDGDGLTYAQELALNTDDNNPDSDADGIPDGEDAHPAGGGENYRITVTWSSGGIPRTTQFGIAEDWYSYYRSQPRIEDPNYWGEYVTPNDPVIKTISEDVADTALTTGEDRIYAAINFVESMTYQFDVDFNSNPEYPKYSIETIIDARGDCEDTSFLMASVLEALGIDTVLLIYSDHVAVGVYCKGCTGTYYEYNGRNYFFLETTGDSGNWEVGWIPEKYANERATIIDV